MAEILKKTEDLDKVEFEKHEDSVKVSHPGSDSDSDSQNESNEDNTTIFRIASLIVPSIKCKRTLPTAKLPKKAYPGSVGYDLFTTHEAYLFPRSTQVFDTGIVNIYYIDKYLIFLIKNFIPMYLGVAFEFPSNIFATIESRSCLSWEFNIEAFKGVIDSDYSEYCFNHGRLHNRIYSYLFVYIVYTDFFILYL